MYYDGVQEGQTPLHCLVMVDTPLNTDALRHLIGTSPNAALMRDLVLTWLLLFVHALFRY
jgi:hypothetical protein